MRRKRTPIEYGAAWNLAATKEFYGEHMGLLVGALESTAPRILADDAPRLTYCATDQIVTPACHTGQIKLLLSEIDFLTANPTARHCVYAGSAPSHKGAMLAELFPHIKFIFIDPCVHLIKYGKKTQYDPEHMRDFLYFSYAPDAKGNINVWDGIRGVVTQRNKKGAKGVPGYRAQLTTTILSTDYRFYILEELFDDDLAEYLCVLPDLVFISDIRSMDENDEHPSTYHILYNSAQVYNWLEILECPAMTKFRCPFTITAEEQSKVLSEYNLASPASKDVFRRCPINYIENFANGCFEHMWGVIHLQAFAPPSSTETRLFTTGSPVTVRYDYVKYEQQMFYSNKIGIYAPGTYQIGLPATSVAALNAMGMCLCANCTLAINIFADYCRAYGSNPISILQRCVEVVGRNFNSMGHGIYTMRHTAVTFNELSRATLAIRNQRVLERQHGADHARAIPQDISDLNNIKAAQYNAALDLLD